MRIFKNLARGDSSRMESGFRLRTMFLADIHENHVNPSVQKRHEQSMRIRLWFIRETEKAVLYSKLPPSRNPGEDDRVWIPKSIMEGRTKMPDGEHHVALPDWFVEKEL